VNANDTKRHTPPRAALIALSALLLCVSDLALANPSATRRGIIFVRVHCAQCHAIDKISPSPLPNAPLLRDLRLKYPVADLQRPLIQGIHPVMPRFQLEASQVEDVMSYLKTLER
jgi:cytochrome c